MEDRKSGTRHTRNITKKKTRENTKNGITDFTRYGRKIRTARIRKQ